MNTVERKFVFTLKQYQRNGFGHSYYFVDVYENTYLKQSIMIDKPLSNEELERFFNVVLSRLQKGDNADFLDSTEIKMNKLISRSKSRLQSLEQELSLKMGQDNFDLHYEKKRYYLVWFNKELNRESHETFHISETYTPLMCLKMAYQMGETQGLNYRILLSDQSTEVDPELLAFAKNEN